MPLVCHRQEAESFLPGQPGSEGESAAIGGGGALADNPNPMEKVPSAQWHRLGVHPLRAPPRPMGESLPLCPQAGTGTSPETPACPAARLPQQATVTSASWPQPVHEGSELSPNNKHLFTFDDAVILRALCKVPEVTA